MDSWPRNISAITLFVEDLAITKRFYRDVFGLPVAFEDDNSWMRCALSSNHAA